MTLKLKIKLKKTSESLAGTKFANIKEVKNLLKNKQKQTV